MYEAKSWQSRGIGAHLGREWGNTQAWWLEEDTENARSWLPHKQREQTGRRERLWTLQTHLQGHTSSSKGTPPNNVSINTWSHGAHFSFKPPQCPYCISTAKKKKNRHFQRSNSPADVQATFLFKQLAIIKPFLFAIVCHKLKTFFKI